MLLIKSQNVPLYRSRDPTVDHEMSRAVNKCVIIIIYQSAEGSQRTKLGIIFNVIAITLYKFDSFKTVVLEVQWPQKGENCIFSKNASANHLYLTVICFIL